MKKNFLALVFFALLSLVPAALFSQVADFRQLTQSEAAGALEEFRAFRMAGDFCYKFEITHYLRKDDATRVFAGTLYGSWDARGPILRVEISPKNEAGAQKTFLLRGGNAPELWTLDAESAQPVRVDGNATEPFFEGLIFSPFDLQTPFVYWKDAVYERTRRFRGRPVHFFKMTPPEKIPRVGFVRIGFDRVYNALVSAEIFDGNGTRQKTFSLSGVKKVQGQYSILALELRDDLTRDKDELRVRYAAFNLLLPKETFLATELSKPPVAVPAKLFSPL